MYHCYLCATELGRSPAFTESRMGHCFASYRCASCGLYQSKGGIASLSPDYLQLQDEDLTPKHLHIQIFEKMDAFAECLQRAKNYYSVDHSSRLLDVGCGVGGFLDYAKKTGLETYGYDLSDPQLQFAKLRHPNVAFSSSVDEYLRAIKRPDLQFDMVTLWDVLEHMRDPIAQLESIRQVMKPGAVVFASVPAAGPIPLKLALAKVRGRDAGLIPWEHVFYHNRRTLQLTFERAGFRVAYVGGIRPYRRDDSSAFESIRILLHRLFRHAPLAFQLSIFGINDR